MSLTNVPVTEKPVTISFLLQVINRLSIPFFNANLGYLHFLGGDPVPEYFGIAFI